MTLRSFFKYVILTMTMGLTLAVLKVSGHGIKLPNPHSLQDEIALIRGRVVDDKGTPLAFATVYISNTTNGDITDENGLYELGRVPYGQHILVVSFVGYESQKTRVQVDKNTLEYNFTLQKADIQIDEVRITDHRGKNKRKKHYKMFLRYFLGTSENAMECTIENPEVLRFSIDPNSRAMVALAYDNLVIVNRALGYRIHYWLEKFEVYRDGSSIYLGKPRYEPMEPSNEAEARKWKINRYLAYTGSFRHFLVSIVHSDFKEQGFSVSMVMDTQSSTQPIERISSAGTLMQPGDRHFERRLSFGYYLYVRFEKEPLYNLRRDQYDLLFYKTQDSWIKMLKPGIVFHTQGYLYDPSRLIFYGHWATEKVADDLPFDYVPESVKL